MERRGSGPLRQIPGFAPATCTNCSFWMRMRHAMPSLAINLVVSTLTSRLYSWLTRSRRSTSSSTYWQGISRFLIFAAEFPFRHLSLPCAISLPYRFVTISRWNLCITLTLYTVVHKNIIYMPLSTLFLTITLVLLDAFLHFCTSGKNTLPVCYLTALSS